MVEKRGHERKEMIQIKEHESGKERKWEGKRSIEEKERNKKD